MAKTKARLVLVWVQSVVSGHHYQGIRERLADKLEIIRFDPWVRQMVIYKETKKIRSLKKSSE